MFNVAVTAHVGGRKAAFPFSLQTFRNYYFLTHSQTNKEKNHKKFVGPMSSLHQTSTLHCPGHQGFAGMALEGDMTVRYETTLRKGSSLPFYSNPRWVCLFTHLSLHSYWLRPCCVPKRQKLVTILTMKWLLGSEGLVVSDTLLITFMQSSVTALVGSVISAISQWKTQSHGEIKFHH